MRDGKPSPTVKTHIDLVGNGSPVPFIYFFRQNRLYVLGVVLGTSLENLNCPGFGVA